MAPAAGPATARLALHAASPGGAPFMSGCGSRATPRLPSAASSLTAPSGTWHK